jgi:LAGLIDADG endonuclease
MCSFIEYFGCGNYYSQSKRQLGDFIVDKFSDIDEKIIPFFHKHKILGVKSLVFEN